MKRIFWLLTVCAFSTFAVSASILVPGPADSNPDSNFTFTIDVGGGTLNLATPGSGDLDQLTVSGIGDLIISDLSTPGQFIFSINTTFTESIGLTFDTAGATVLDGGTHVAVNAFGAPLTAVSDPALSALLGPSVFDFVSAGSAESPFVFNFDSAALGVPEPATVFVVGIPLLGLAALRLRKRSHWAL